MSWSLFKQDENRRKWSIRGRDHTGAVRKLPAFADKAISSEMAGTVASLVEHRQHKHPLPPALSAKVHLLPEPVRKRLSEWDVLPRSAQAASRDIDSQIDEYLAGVAAGGATEDHIEETRRLLKRITATQQISSVADLTSEAVANFCAELRKKKRSQRTINKALAAAKSLTKWLVQKDRIGRDPLAVLKLGSVDKDRRLIRRPLLHAEWPYLYATTFRGPERYGMTGPDRALLYAVAIQTGLRADELKTRTAARFILTATRPHVEAEAKATKNGTDCEQALRPETVDVLRDRLAHVHPSAPVFNMPADKWTAVMLREDLAAAREAWINAAADPSEKAERDRSDFLAAANHKGQVVDFHALRHTTAVWWAMSGLYPKAVQRIMRHSTLTLTMDLYGRFFPEDSGEKPIPFPHMHPDQLSRGVALQATGTDGAPRGAGRGAEGGQSWTQTPPTVDDTAPQLGLCDEQESAENAGKTAVSSEIPAMPEEGLEPTHLFRVTDFESVASASSATPAGVAQCSRVGRAFRSKSRGGRAFRARGGRHTGGFSAGDGFGSKPGAETPPAARRASRNA